MYSNDYIYLRVVTIHINYLLNVSVISEVFKYIIMII